MGFSGCKSSSEWQSMAFWSNSLVLSWAMSSRAKDLKSWLAAMSVQHHIICTWRRGSCSGLSVLPAHYSFPPGNKSDLYRFCWLWNTEWFVSNGAEHLTLGGSTWLAAQPDEPLGKVLKGYPKENNFNDIANKYTHTMRKWHCSWRGDIHKEFTSWIISRGDLVKLLPISGGLKMLEVLNVFF